LNVMFDMWTDPKHVAQWLPPTGATMEFIKADIKPGGSSFYCMEGPMGKMYGRADYLKIERPNLIVYSQQFCDEHEKVARHPMSATWPETMVTTVLLTEEEPDRTRVTITWEAREATEEEMATFIQARGGMTMGWTGSLDKLEARLELLTNAR